MDGKYNWGFEILTAVIIICDITPCSPYHLNFQSRKSAEKEPACRKLLGRISGQPGYQFCGVWMVRERGLRAGAILAQLIFDPECGGITFLRNACSHMDYMMLYPRKWQHSWKCNHLATAPFRILLMSLALTSIWNVYVSNFSVVFLSVYTHLKALQWALYFWVTGIC
jgi:hypothetical protein